MKFSIVVPVHNAERYLQECVESVLCQINQNVELILVNDGSTDSSGQICDRYQSMDPGHVRVIHTANQGALLARAQGIRQASGDVLLFLDADDALRPDALRILEAGFASSGCDLIVFNGSTKEDFSVPYQKYPFANGTVIENGSRKTLYEAMVSTGCLNNLCLKAVKRSVIDPDTDYSPFAHVRNGEDLLMSAVLLTNANRILILDENLYFYRQHSGSTVHNAQPHRASSVKTVHLYLEQLIDRWELPELHPMHHAREVRGWIETLAITCDYKCPAEVQREMADEPYFRNAYEKMDPSFLRKRDQILARLLYTRQFLVLRMVWAVRRMLCSLKHYLREL